VRHVPATTLITAFEVPPEADEAFLASRESGPLYRALRADVDFRFVAISDAVADVPFPAHTSRYEVVRVHGTPDVEGGVVLIDPVEVPAAEDERFLDGWDRGREVLARRRGYLGSRLYRAVEPAELRFIEIVRWSSPLMVARAQREPDHPTTPFPSHPALYQPIRGE
jgi:hypothetical protein